jgi:SAM-dependent methyltransferase
MDRTIQSEATRRQTFGGAVGSFLTRNFPPLRKGFWRTTYNEINRYVSAEDFVFMNLGYASEDDLELPRPIPPDYFAKRLYERVIGAVVLADKDVIEVGCGRGGGAAHVLEKYAPKSLIGADVSARGVARCRAQHQRDRLQFQVANAMELPFAADHFDAVLNVESSHCYPSRAQFFAEARRVLRPGGHLLFTDLIWPQLDGVTVSDLQNALVASGLRILETEDISKDVLRARTLMSDDPEFEKTLSRWMAPAGRFATKQSGREAYFLRGSFQYDNLVQGRASYWRWILRKD